MEQSVDLKQVLGYVFEPTTVAYNRRDLLTYAIGIGAVETRFAFEDDPDFSAYPTYPVVLGLKGAEQDIVQFGSGPSMLPPGLVIDPSKLLHGEQAIELFQEVPLEGTFTSQTKVTGFADKGKGALMSTETSMTNDQGQLICKLRSGIFFRGLTGFGGERGSSAPVNVPPPRAPDAVEAIPTLPHQALIYRLSGDYNPLHADEGMATMVGFEKPILHGLCTLGMSSRAILKRFCNNDPKNFRGIAVRFAASVYPGVSLTTVCDSTQGHWLDQSLKSFLHSFI